MDQEIIFANAYQRYQSYGLSDIQAHIMAKIRIGRVLCAHRGVYSWVGGSNENPNSVKALLRHGYLNFRDGEEYKNLPKPAYSLI